MLAMLARTEVVARGLVVEPLLDVGVEEAPGRREEVDEDGVQPNPPHRGEPASEQGRAIEPDGTRAVL